MFLYEQHCEEKSPPALLTQEQNIKFLKEIPLWQSDPSGKYISRTYKLQNYQQTLLFINAVAEIAHTENHHPEITFGYNHCSIHFFTHSANGITLFDIICAAQVDHLLFKQDFKI